MNLNHFRGWEVELENNEVIREGQVEWKNIPKISIRRLTLRYDGREWNISDKPDYFQKKRASVVPGVPDSFKVESRSIGYYEGNSKVLYTVDEDTGRMTIEVK